MIRKKKILRAKTILEFIYSDLFESWCDNYCNLDPPIEDRLDILQASIPKMLALTEEETHELAMYAYALGVADL